MLLGPGPLGNNDTIAGHSGSVFRKLTISVALGEIAFETAGMMPEISFGSHFFQDLVEANIFYLAILPHIAGNLFQTELILERPNLFAHLLPQHQRLGIGHPVCDYSADNLTLFSDIMSQQLTVHPGVTVNSHE